MKMYKSRIKQWSLDKKNKEHEMRAIVRRNFNRVAKGKSLAFHIRGKVVDFGEVVRYWERKRVSIDEVIAQRAISRSPGIECVTPIPLSLRIPEALAVTGHVLLAIRDYHQGCLESETWKGNNGIGYCQVLDRECNRLSFILSFVNQAQLGCELFARNLFIEGRQALDTAFAEMGKIIEAQHPATFTETLKPVITIRQQGRHEIGLMILRQFSAMAALLLGQHHPIYSICRWLAILGRTHQTCYEDIVCRCFQAVCDCFDRFIGPLQNLNTLNRTNGIQDMIGAVDSKFWFRETIL